MKLYLENINVTCVLIIGLVAITMRAEAEPASLWIVNPSDVDVSVSVEAINGDLEGSIGENVLEVPAGSSKVLHTGRDSSNSGSVGRGKLIFDPSPLGTFSYMDVHGDNGMFIHDQHANRYPGRFGKSASSYSYLGPNVFVLAKAPPLRKTEYEWRRLCSYPSCGNDDGEPLSFEFTSEVIHESDFETEKEMTRRNNICVDLQGEGAVYSGTLHACIDTENRVKRSSKLGKKLTNTTIEKKPIPMSKGVNAAMQKNGINAIFYVAELPNPGNGWSNQRPTYGKALLDFRSCPTGRKTPTYEKEEIPAEDDCTRMEID